MKMTVGAAARLGALVLAVVLVQVSAFSSLPLFGGQIDLIPLLVAAVGLVGGSTSGAIAGFATGLAIDLAVGLNVGATSLVLPVVGYVSGRFREVRDPANSLIPIPVAAVATLAYLGGLGFVSFMLDFGASVSPLVLRHAAVTVILSALVALPVFALVRRVLRPVLVVDPLARPARARTRETGPIGLRGLGRV